jgi:calcineurin-like phosphoesterase family protein
MSNVFFASDHHFGHGNILNFFKADGITPLRPFANVVEHDETLIDNHNRIVGPKDVVYLLGDVAIPRKGLQQVKRLNGRLRLIMGNHDPFVKNFNRDYADVGFEQIEAFHKFDRFVATHIPVHSDSLSTRWHVNVHGHLHDNVVRLPYRVDARTGMIKYSDNPDPRYINVCMEKINYTPISLEEINARLD